MIWNPTPPQTTSLCDLWNGNGLWNKRFTPVNRVGDWIIKKDAENAA